MPKKTTKERRGEKNFFGASKKYAQKEEKKRKRERKGTHINVNKYDTGFREERR